ncbi:DUF2231 domain-containing protein [Couchioplanes azureus]|uniref:DUF2231 domain-containing protein n=1 Tax=Couchioplanes caeruleus TaxID=56438 RepID=UPI00166F8A13|nr:DUF2231 domain-containing protein [Couchioplanes caeruleus]GGQ48774.1 hypothetical protein GCM10010166_16340 [Couchioplanes caeruleus subsp. azureus]
METRLSVRGNAVQPLLLMFPAGLLTVAVILDVFQLLGTPRLLGALAYCTVVAGLVGGTVTAVAVRIDSLVAGGGRRETVRSLLDLAVLVVFAVVLLVRMRTPDRTAGPGLVVLEVLGLGLAGFALWFGARDAGSRFDRRTPCRTVAGSRPGAPTPRPVPGTSGRPGRTTASSSSCRSWPQRAGR